MPSAIGSWRRRENSGRFIPNRLREERKGQFPVNSLLRSSRGRVLRVWKLRKGERAMKIRYHFNTLPLLALLVAAGAADAQVQPQLAQRWFAEATKLCERDAGRLWGVSLCGPMVIVDHATGTRATSQPEPEGQPPRFPGLVDGPVSWGGVRWFSFPLYMLPEKDADTRQQIMRSEERRVGKEGRS